MDRKIFHRLFEERIVMLDGATGSNLMQAGMPVGVCPEKWILEHPQHLIKLQRAYIQAGTNILLAPTFTANRIKLAEYHLEDKIHEMNMQLVDLTRTAIEQENHRGFIAGDMTMTGRQLQPHDGPDLQKRQHLLPQKCLIYKTGITAYLSYI